MGISKGGNKPWDADLTQSTSGPWVFGFVLRQRDTLGETVAAASLRVSVCVHFFCSPEYETQPRQLAKNLPT